MFMSSSGSFTWRKAWRTVSALSTAVVTAMSPPANLATWNTPHQTVTAPRDPGVHSTRQREYSGEAKQRRKPAFAGEQPEQLGDRIRPGEHATIGCNQMHRGRERRQRDPKTRDRGCVLERHEPQGLFPVPALQDCDRLLADPAFSIVDQRGISARHRRRARQRRLCGREPL